MNLGDPDLADKYSSLPADGIGLMREEFLWTTFIHEHPLYLIEQGHPEKVVNMLADGIAKVVRAMAPRPVVLRFSDFKSSEYRNLKGGDKYEPHEPADLLGWRGASRYYDSKYIEAFKLELAAVKKVRNEFGLKNLNVMIPFVRTVDEAQKVTTIMRDEGLARSADFKVYMMAEIPTNIILADQFNQFVDGYSIGSNDLAMLILGCDRNNDTVAHLFDERNLAVKRAIRHLIKTVMIPFVRTVDEAQKVTTIMRDEGLARSADFKVYMMAEIPTNIILADQFNQFVDGYSIGSNDLAMLILGCDRNNDTVAHLFDERNLAVKRAIRHLIKTAHKDGKTVSICGQAPSEYPEFTNFLIQSGIDYVSVNPDMVKETKRNVAHFEQRIMLDKATGRGLQDPIDYKW
ncbi:hypothetical protein WP50_28455 [Lactiplantibacillus plantarum]|nr:hypothetical protein WP50_28455 [Lactiplantibacillus plantarum]